LLKVQKTHGLELIVFLYRFHQNIVLVNIDSVALYLRYRNIQPYFTMLSIVPSQSPVSCKQNRAGRNHFSRNTCVSARIWDLHSILVDPASAPSEAKDASKQILNILAKTATRVPWRMVIPPLSFSIDHEDTVSPPDHREAISSDFQRALTDRDRPDALPPITPPGRERTRRVQSRNPKRAMARWLDRWENEGGTWQWAGRNNLRTS
jgi:hypothetical protein